MQYRQVICAIYNWVQLKLKTYFVSSLGYASLKLELKLLSSPILGLRRGTIYYYILNHINKNNHFESAVQTFLTLYSSDSNSSILSIRLIRFFLNNSISGRLGLTFRKALFKAIRGLSSFNSIVLR